MLYDSVQRWYPGTPVIVSDDSQEFALAGWEAPFLRVFPLSYDSGLSFARNSLLREATTEYVFVIDDDFIFTQTSNLDVLLKLLESSPFDVAAAVIPADEELYKISFRGLLSTRGGTLELSAGSRGSSFGCLHVDFTPNVFLARRTVLLLLGWDPNLKLGEHEEFFLRAQAAGVRILSCSYAEVQHNQRLWWKEEAGADNYVEKRKRVYEFLQAALRKHNLQRLVSFGNLVTELV
jgi:glycosyltransferase involved in cell wall biosynthesis